MKLRESGMPDEAWWETFFDPEFILSSLGLDERVVDVVEFGCGYGTFTLPAARLVSGQVHAFDIDQEMIARAAARAADAGIENVRPHLCDLGADGSGLPDEGVDYVMLFNILHAEHPLPLLGEAHRILRPRGKLGIIHWNYDPTTPRGPSMAIRPRPEQCQGWAEEAGFRLLIPLVDLPPYHYGILAEKPQASE